ncbi:ATP-binding protein [Nocardioides dubius]|uniref:Histidine kinase/HSP90-like ATPase domain-containing protein n=1 Tax=Nocardioides dubius TaxID=317019 RepID=A0ABN1TSR7_9ACTN
MPLTKPTLTLEPNPRSVQDARRWVSQACQELGREDLIECAEIGVSELVTNALLHAEPPIGLRIRGTRLHPRIEVSDGSAKPPVPNPRMGDDDELLSTIGRGLGMVAMCSSAWGAYLQRDGKTVWFEPATTLAEDPSVFGEVYEASALQHPKVAPGDGHQVHLLGLPVGRFAAWARHFRDLSRELRLLALAHAAAYPTARVLSDLFGTFGEEWSKARGLELLDGATEDDPRVLDLTVSISASAPAMMSRMIDVLELADAFCRNERMLTLATTADQAALQRWLFTELVRQPAGDLPTSCPRSPVANQPGHH